jgi:hypothetical protein
VIVLVLVAAFDQARTRTRTNTRTATATGTVCTAESGTVYYDGSPDVAKEILRGLAAARTMDMDCRVFEDALAERHRVLSAA